MKEKDGERSREMADEQEVLDSKAPSDVVFATLVWAVLVYAVASLQGFSSAARTLPLMVGVPALGLASINLAIQLWRRFWIPDRKGATMSERLRASALELGGIAWLVLFGGLIFVVGLLYALPLFLGSYLWFHGSEGVKTIVYTLVPLMLLGFVLERLVGIPMPPGAARSLL